MQYLFIPMTEHYAREIVDNWHYAREYSFYDMDADEKDLAIFMNRDYWETITFAVLNDENELAGWATFYEEGDIIWLSLGMKPALTGKGLGQGFVSACISHARSNPAFFKPIMKLDVAEFNERALKVYQRAGFVESERIVTKTHVGDVPFIRMERML